jgi:hypothetical protein
MHTSRSGFSTLADLKRGEIGGALLGVDQIVDRLSGT